VGFTTYVVSEFFKRQMPAGLRLLSAGAIPARFGAAVAGCWWKLVIRHLYGRPLETCWRRGRWGGVDLGGAAEFGIRCR